MSSPLPRRGALVPLASALVAGCVAIHSEAPVAERFVYFETESYACGAAEGLGCGLALQPALVRLDALDGVAQSAVSWNGRFLRVHLQPDADAERVAAAVATELEGDERLVPARDAAEVESWFGSECCLDLSMYEAGVIASCLVAEVAAEVEIDEPASRQLEAVLREELERAFRQAHAEGGGVSQLWEQLPAGRASLEQRLDFLAPAQRAQVLAQLEESLGSATEPCP